MHTKWHLLPLSITSQLLNTTQAGIDKVTATQRLNEYEKNQITDKKKKTVLHMLLQQLTDFMILVPILAVHILWINLVTDGLPGLALASEPSEATIMKRPPRERINF